MVLFFVKILEDAKLINTIHALEGGVFACKTRIMLSDQYSRPCSSFAAPELIIFVIIILCCFLYLLLMILERFLC